MDNTNGNPQEPSYAYCYREVSLQVASASVDLSWLNGYDFDKLEAALDFITSDAWNVSNEMAEELVLDGKDPGCPVGMDLMARSDAVGTAITRTMRAYSEYAEEDEPLYPFLVAVAEQAYELGMRDAQGLLSDEYLRFAFEKWDAIDQDHRGLREFYDDIRTS